MHPTYLKEYNLYIPIPCFITKKVETSTVASFSSSRGGRKKCQEEDDFSQAKVLKLKKLLMDIKSHRTRRIKKAIKLQSSVLEMFDDHRRFARCHANSDLKFKKAIISINNRINTWN